ncbi:MAG: NCS2 family permease [Acutalibacteraceae bacterium]|nr:NCS2 family permease [Clostridia bacterium]MEE3451014.1 NCS2 family permease [Acutalibacteraceae bacterium]
MEKFFKIKERGSTVKTEVFAGITTFMAMAYILMVNAGMFSDLPEVSYNAVYIATAISAVVGTLLIGLLANLPLAQASGMGLNAFFVYTVCFGFGLTYANALTLVMLDGIVFIILTATGLRKKIFDSIPKCVKAAIPAGIGLFIAFLGFQNSGIVTNDDSTLVTLASFNVFKGNAEWRSIMPMLVTLLVIITIAVLSIRKIKGAVLWGILGGSVLYYLLGLTIPDFYNGFADKLTLNPFTAFVDFGKESFFKVFTQGFDYSAYLEHNSVGSLIILIATTALAFCLVDMFDTMGTLYGACSQGNLLTKDGEVPNMNKAMLADALATTVGSVCGTSTVTTFVEASAGIAEGGRTGLAAMVSAAMFFIAMFLSPIAALIPGCATAAALIYVGILMIKCVKDIEWEDISVAAPAFVTIVMMPFTYNISYGIAFGLLTYVCIKLFIGKFKEINLGTLIITVLFILMFMLTH